jgi:ubiquinone/menaquinone biosynthesis C-methylase UbiE
MWGLIRSGNADTYGYIADSLARYPRRADLHRLFREHGLQIIEAQVHFLGVIETSISSKAV